MTMRSTNSKPKTIDQYLALVKPQQRAVLEKLRKTFMPPRPERWNTSATGWLDSIQRATARSFRRVGKSLALYAASPAVQKKFQKELQGFECSKGTIRFTPEKPLPPTLVKALVRARLAENAA